MLMSFFCFTAPILFALLCNLEDGGFTVVLGVTDDLASCSVVFFFLYFFFSSSIVCLPFRLAAVNFLVELRH